jgi:Chaperone of endosialidase
VFGCAGSTPPAPFARGGGRRRGDWLYDYRIRFHDHLRVGDGSSAGTHLFTLFHSERDQNVGIDLSAFKNRTELKSYFVKDAIPTAAQFAALIDGSLNLKDYGIAKPANDALCIQASGDAASTQNAINFYGSFGDASPSWLLNLKPRTNPSDASTAKPGLAISDGAGNHRLFIDQKTGNVGIGTITPASKLEVGSFATDSDCHIAVKTGLGDHYRAGIKLRCSTDGYGFTIEHDDRAQPRGLNILRYEADLVGKSALFIARGTGNVGIGIVDPGANLDVNGTAGKTALKVTGNASISGNVGIGKAVPSDVLLDVGGTVRASKFVGDWSGSNPGIDGKVNKLGDTMTGLLTISLPNQTALTVNGNANITGNVGIGKAAPSDVRLDVAGTVRATSFNGDGSNLGGLVKSVGGTMTGTLTIPGLKVNGDATVTGTAHVNAIKIADANGTDYPGNWIGMSKGIDSDGKEYLHIGGIDNTGDKRRIALWAAVTRVQEDLLVGGKIWSYGSANNNWMQLGKGISDGTYWYGGTLPSDLRFKSEVQPVPSALDKVRRLCGVTFRWNEDALQHFTRDIETTICAGPDATEPENQRVWQTERDRRRKELAATHVGVVAQDVETVLPEAVTTDADGYKSVRYDNLIPLLIEAIKEQDRAFAAHTQLEAQQHAEIERLNLAQLALLQRTSRYEAVNDLLLTLEKDKPRVTNGPTHAK